VHGDLKPGNIAISGNYSASTLLVFDWANAGWGIPLVDLAQATPAAKQLAASPDLTAYWERVREFQPQIDVASIYDLAKWGTIFRCITAIYWEAIGLADMCTEAPMVALRTYLEVLDHNTLEFQPR